MPTHSSQDIKHKIERPDHISITGAKVIAGMTVDNRNPTATVEQKSDPQTIEVDNIPGLGQVTVRWIIQGNAKYTISVDSRKGGLVSRGK